jgi:hypothetical protein
MNKRDPAIEARKKQKKQQQQHSSRGARGQLQGKVWDPGGVQHWRRGDNEKELMIFPTMEYDAGASLYLSNVPTFQHINAHFREGEALTLPF